MIKGSTFTLGGMAKGCGMIAPNMATMLAFLTTDADVPRSVMQKALKAAADATLQHAQRRRRDVDQRHGDAARVRASAGRPITTSSPMRVLAACRDLTMQMARDAEGMTRMAHLTVTGARNDEEARIAAKTIVENNLVKCSWYGGDPYWGRLMAAAGSAGVDLECRQVARQLRRDRGRQGRRRHASTTARRSPST